MDTKFYLEPNIDIHYVGVEQGFEASENRDGLPGDDPYYNSFGEF